MTIGVDWSTFFQTLIGQLPCLRSLRAFFLYEGRYGSSRSIHFPALASNPVVRGSETRMKQPIPLAVFGTDRHLLKGMKVAVQLFHNGQPDMIVGVKYEGSQMDLLLEALAASAETER